MLEFSKYSYKSEDDLKLRINNILDNSFENIDKKEALRLIFSFIDLTTLEGSDTDKKVAQLCKKALSFKEKYKTIPNVAAICVYPTLVKIAKDNLQNSKISVASVAGAFPGGQSPISIKIVEVKYAIEQGADEIDMVISRGKLIEGKFDVVFDEIKAIKNACNDIHLKVILETGELKTVENIRKASELAINAGADFIKTSTGKINPAATETAFVVMLDTIKEYYEKTGKMIGIKPAGGIRESDEALKYFCLVKEILGEKWLNKNYFRIGASSLADNVFNDILNLQ
ncbi:MAG: deoxyribose-phosphate aldolase [Bacteroidales bacterium]|nr:deoxyribose-phosphate aldolase [Bacteroidales bacterium]